MNAQIQRMIAGLLLLAVSLPGGLGVGLHALAPNDTSEASGCSCCCACVPSDDSEQPSISAVEICLVCKFLATAKRVDVVADTDQAFEPQLSNRVALSTPTHALRIALPISARGPPA